MKVMLPQYDIIHPTELDAETVYKLLEDIGRTCYKSHDRVTEQSSRVFVKMLNDRKHHAMLEHYSISVRIVMNRGFCYDDKTEVLTKDGWKLFKDSFSKNEEYLTLNPETKETCYQKRTDETVEYWDGELICGESSMVDFAVTPNHRMYWYHYDSRKSQYWKIDKAKDVYGRRVKLLRGLQKDWEGKDIVEEFPQQSTEEFAKFMGIFITDGCLWKGKDTGGRVTLVQVKQDGRKFIRECLTNLNWNYKEKEKSFHINNTKLYHFLRRYFPVNEKKTYTGRVPEWVRMASKKYISAFLEGVIAGDGSVHKKNKHVVVYTASKEMAGDYQECFLKAGVCSSIRVDDRRGQEREITPGIIIQNKVIQYVVSVTKRTNEHLFNKHHWNKRYYKGKVYCVTVPNGLLYVRRNGKAFWCGNTHELVRHRLASFAQESTRYCNYSSDRFYNEISFIHPYWYDDAPREARELWDSHMRASEQAYMKLLELGVQPQGARGVLPLDLKTEIVITANIREWKTIFSLRDAEPAHPDMRRVMAPLHEEFQKALPEIFN